MLRHWEGGWATLPSDGFILPWSLGRRVLQFAPIVLLATVRGVYVVSEREFVVESLCGFLLTRKSAPCVALSTWRQTQARSCERCGAPSSLSSLRPVCGRGTPPFETCRSTLPVDVRDGLVLAARAKPLRHGGGWLGLVLINQESVA